VRKFHKEIAVLVILPLVVFPVLLWSLVVFAVFLWYISALAFDIRVHLTRRRKTVWRRLLVSVASTSSELRSRTARDRTSAPVRPRRPDTKHLQLILILLLLLLILVHLLKLVIHVLLLVLRPLFPMFLVLVLSLIVVMGWILGRLDVRWI